MTTAHLLRNKTTVFFPASMKGVGLLYHFTFLSVALASELRDSRYKFVMLSEKGEQNKGLWDIIKNNLSREEYRICDNYSQFAEIYAQELEKDGRSRIIILTQGIMQFLDCIPIKRKYRDRVIVYTRLNSFRHGTKWRWPITALLSELFIRYCDIVNFQCNYTIDIFANSKKILASGKGVTIPLGMNRAPEVQPRNGELLEILNDERTFKVVYLANLHPWKNHKAIIEASIGFLKQNKKVKFLFLGEGALRSNLEALAKKWKVSEQIVFAGRIDRKHIPYVLKRSQLALALSKVETFGHNILEPLFHNVPVIATNVGIASDVIKDFQNGYVLRRKDFKNLGEILEHFYDNKALDHIAEYKMYEWSSVAKSYRGLFDLLERRSKSE